MEAPFLVEFGHFSLSFLMVWMDYSAVSCISKKGKYVWQKNDRHSVAESMH